MRNSHWTRIPDKLVACLFEGAVGVEHGADGLRPWRLRPADRDLIPPGLINRCRTTSGVRLRLRTDASRIRLEATPEGLRYPRSVPGGQFDLCINGKFRCCVTLPEDIRGTLVFDKLPQGENTLDIYFPTHTAVVLHSAELESGTAIAPPPPRPRWVTHGSSITHCRMAQSPAYTWPAMVGRVRNWDAWNLGFGGQCKFDQIVARTIRDLPADRISLCLGINTHQGSYSPRTWMSAVEGFILTVRDGHPATPLLVVSPIFSAPRERSHDTPQTISLESMREMLRDIVHRFQSRGDAHIHYMSGLEIIGADDAGCMPDQLHPDAAGIKLMAKRFLSHAPAEWVGGHPARLVLG